MIGTGVEVVVERSIGNMGAPDQLEAAAVYRPGTQIE
jgi:hypothetical protein